jgi:hypothetical protein
MVEALIDSGSTGEFIEIAAVPNDVDIDQTDTTTIEGFTGKTVTSIGSVTTNVKTAPDGTEFEEVKFSVVERAPYPVVLGLSFLRDYQALVDIAGEQVILPGELRVPLRAVAPSSDDVDRSCSMAEVSHPTDSPSTPTELPEIVACQKPSSLAVIHGTEDEVRVITALIDDEFSDVFDYDGSHVGSITERTGVWHYIDTGDARPVAKAPYRMSPKERELTGQWIEEQLRTGAISPAPAGTEWAAPCLWVPKPGGGQGFARITVV